MLLVIIVNIWKIKKPREKLVQSIITNKNIHKIGFGKYGCGKREMTVRFY